MRSAEDLISTPPREFVTFFSLQPQRDAYMYDHIHRKYLSLRNVFNIIIKEFWFILCVLFNMKSAWMDDLHRTHYLSRDQVTRQITMATGSKNLPSKLGVLFYPDQNHWVSKVLMKPPFRRYGPNGMSPFL